MIERRSQESFCSKHGEDMRSRYNNTIICLVHGCDWEVPARRKLDQQIETLGDIKAKWA